jgi:hypothetical protein
VLWLIVSPPHDYNLLSLPTIPAMRLAMRVTFRLGCLVSAIVALWMAKPGPAEPLSPKQFQQLWNVIRPQPGEDKWDEIAWRANLWEARREAAAKGKPILLWEMDGHPLGCT